MMVGTAVDGQAPPDTVRIWLIPADVPDLGLRALSRLLDGDELDRLGAMAQPRDRRRFTVAHACARMVLARHVGSPPAALRWDRGPNGKPHLSSPAATVQISLSHSGELCLIALADQRAVGVDIEAVRTGLDAAALADRYFPREEAAYVAAATDAPGRAARFAALWTRKEALVKAYGGRLFAGLTVPVGHTGTAIVDRHRLRSLPAAPGYRAAVAVAGSQPYRVELRRWRWGTGPVTV